PRFIVSLVRRHLTPTLFPYTTLFRSRTLSFLEAELSHVRTDDPHVSATGEKEGLVRIRDPLLIGLIHLDKLVKLVFGHGLFEARDEVRGRPVLEELRLVLARGLVGVDLR